MNVIYKDNTSSMIKGVAHYAKTSMHDIAEDLGKAAAWFLGKNVLPPVYTLSKKQNAERSIVNNINKVYKSQGSLYSKLKDVNPGLAYGYSRELRKGNIMRCKKYCRIAGLSDEEIRLATQGIPFDGGMLYNRLKRGGIGKIPPHIYVNIHDPSYILWKTRQKLFAWSIKSAWLDAGDTLKTVKGLGAKKRPKTLIYHPRKNQGAAYVHRGSKGIYTITLTNIAHDSKRYMRSNGNKIAIMQAIKFKHNKWGRYLERQFTRANKKHL